MKNTCAEDNATVTHLLGYLTAKQWVSALNDKDTDTTLIWQLIYVQDEAYNGHMLEEVKRLIKEMRNK
jgi:transcription initiation factor IIE alpha subunit